MLISLEKGKEQEKLLIENCKLVEENVRVTKSIKKNTYSEGSWIYDILYYNDVLVKIEGYNGRELIELNIEHNF